MNMSNLTKDELIIINNVLNEILNGSSAIVGSEFDTLIGDSKENVENLLLKIQQIIKEEDK